MVVKLVVGCGDWVAKFFLVGLECSCFGQVLIRGVNIRPNPQTQHELDTGFCGLGLGLNGFGS